MRNGWTFIVLTGRGGIWGSSKAQVERKLTKAAYTPALCGHDAFIQYSKMGTSIIRI